MSDAEPKVDEARRTLTNGQVLGFIVGQWRRAPGIFAAAMVLMLMSVACDMGLPWAAAGLVEAVSAPPGSPAAGAWRAWGLFVAVYVAFFALRNVAYLVWNPFAASNMAVMIREAFARVQLFSTDWHANNFAGATVRKVSRGMWGYDGVSDQLTLFLGPSLLVLIGLDVSMLARWPLVGLFALVVTAAYIALSLAMAQIYIRPANLASSTLDSEMGAMMADAVTSNAAVKSFGAEAREEERFGRTAQAWRKASVHAWNRGVRAWAAQNAVMVLLQAGLTGILVDFWSRGRADAGDVVFAITSFMLMSGYLRNFGENVRQLQRGLDDTEAVAAYMRTDPQVADAPAAPPFRPGRGEVVFDRVTFAYAGARALLYDRFTLRIAPGERLALVGPTGSGKSTFVKLIQRLYDVQGGQILIDRQDIATVTQGSLRRAIAMVPQDPALFHRTIAENIAYAMPDAGHDEIVAAAKKARAHGFISALPKGYDTLVGERGVKLSGGERQRVAIARALLADTPILIFDEATSSLDVETERLVQEAAEALMAGRTTIVIAHRLSTIRGADRILVFDEGKVVEEGAHGELVARQGVYARLHAVTQGAR